MNLNKRASPDIETRSVFRTIYFFLLISWLFFSLMDKMMNYSDRNARQSFLLLGVFNPLASKSHMIENQFSAPLPKLQRYELFQSQEMTEILLND